MQTQTVAQGQTVGLAAVQGRPPSTGQKSPGAATAQQTGQV